MCAILLLNLLETRRSFTVAYKKKVVEEWDANKHSMDMKAFAFRNSKHAKWCMKNLMKQQKSHPLISSVGHQRRAENRLMQRYVANTFEVTFSSATTS